MHTIRPLQQTMDLIRTLLSRVTSLFFTRKLDADLDEELRTHIDLAIEENLDRGMSQQQARTAALRSFGGVTQIYERYREQRGIPLLEQMKRDIRFCLRQLRRSPGFAVTAILTLALGVGANTAIFTLIDSIILRPLPYPDQDRLVNISAGGFFPKGWIRALQQNSQSFASISAYGLNAESNIAGRDSAERVFGSRVTVNTFDTLGIRPALGNFFTSENSVEGQDHVVVLSYGYWRERFAEAATSSARQFELTAFRAALSASCPPASSFLTPTRGSSPPSPSKAETPQTPGTAMTFVASAASKTASLPRPHRQSCGACIPSFSRSFLGECPISGPQIRGWFFFSTRLLVTRSRSSCFSSPQ